MKHLHFIGISGALMTGAAKLAQDAGFVVSGSDCAFYPPFGDMARALNIPLYEGYAADVRSRAADCYVVGNAISRGNPLLESVLSSRLPYISAAQWLGENIMHNKTVLAVAGTHGKTTTAAILTWILHRAGYAPGFLAGGVLPNFGVSAAAGQSELFVVEADEYDSAFFDKRPKFLHYRPTAVILNNLEFDHADIYDNIGDIVRQFHFLLRTVVADGQIIARAQDINIAAAIKMGAYSPISYFGDGGQWRWKYANHIMHILYEEKTLCSFCPPLPGAFNRDNIVAAAAAAHYVGADMGKLGEYLQGFRAPLRRLQPVADCADILIYDDFAHHPTAFDKTIMALTEMHPGRRIVAVFEPRSNTMKSGKLKGRLATAFVGAARIIAVGEQEWLAESLLPLGDSATICKDAKAAAAKLQEEIRPGDCVVLMSNGDFGGLPKMAAAMVKA